MSHTEQVTGRYILPEKLGKSQDSSEIWDNKENAKSAMKPASLADERFYYSPIRDWK
jgi:hypothetical protein